MELGTIKERLKIEHYLTVGIDRAIISIRLVCHNCYLYNKPDEDVIYMTKQVENYFVDKLTKMQKSTGKNETSHGPNATNINRKSHPSHIPSRSTYTQSEVKCRICREDSSAKASFKLHTYISVSDKTD